MKLPSIYSLALGGIGIAFCALVAWLLFTFLGCSASAPVDRTGLTALGWRMEPRFGHTWYLDTADVRASIAYTGGDTYCLVVYPDARHRRGYRYITWQEADRLWRLIAAHLSDLPRRSLCPEHYFLLYYREGGEWWQMSDRYRRPMQADSAVLAYMEADAAEGESVEYRITYVEEYEVITEAEWRRFETLAGISPKVSP